MRLLLVARRTPPSFGGAQSFLLELIAALQRGPEPPEVTAVTGASVQERSCAEILRRQGVQRLLVAPSLDSPSAAAVADLAPLLEARARDAGAELVHLVGGELAPLAAPLREADLAVVVSLLGEEADTRVPPAPAGILWTVPSRAAAERLREAGGPEARVLPPAVDLARFRPGERRTARESLGLTPDHPLVLTTGGLTDPRSLLGAVTAVARSRRDPLWVVAGEGPAAPRIAARAGFLGAGGRLLLTGPVEEDLMPVLYRAADLFLAPSPGAAGGTGSAVTEALASGLPVVGPRTGALGEWIGESGGGRLAPPEDPAALAEVLDRLLEAPEDAAALGREARRRAEARYGRDRLAEVSLDVYTEAREVRQGRTAAAAHSPRARAPRSRGRSVARSPDRVVVLLPLDGPCPGLPRAIDGVLAQTWPRVDLYVTGAADELDEELMARHPRVSFLRLRRSGDLPAVATLALEITESELVALQGPEGWSRPERLERQIAFLDRQLLDGCGSWTRQLDLHGDPVGFWTPAPFVSGDSDRAPDEQLHPPTALLRRRALELVADPDARGANREGEHPGDEAAGAWRRLLRGCEIGNVQRLLYHETVRPRLPEGAGEAGATGRRRPAELLEVRPGEGNRTLRRRGGSP